MPPQRTSDDVKCHTCGILVRARGLVPHAKKCRKLAREKEEDDEVKAIIEEAAKKFDPIKIWSMERHNHENEAADSEDNIDMQGSMPRSRHSLILDFNMALPGLQSHYDDANPADQEPLLQLDDIKVDYHPHSQIPSTIHHFADFSCTRPMEASVPWSHTPWEPFWTQLDFEVAEIALEAALNTDQTNRLLSLRLYKFNGMRFVCFINEPWTADAFWDAQSRLPPEAKPLAFILYADKAKLSSFGTQKAYPIVCWIANLPVEIRNGTGLGGGRIVGWLPIVSEDPEHAGKSSFVNFKNAVWHESFLKLLESVIQISRTGYWFECGDAIRCLLWPLILILSADYEEQCVMALICGLKGKFPCPICLVPRDEQSVLSHELRLRTSTESEETLRLAHSKKSKKERENLLKTYSLHDIENVFWRILLTDIHRVLSFDCMHVHHGGLWRHHLWKELQFWILELGREAVAEIDVNYDAFPRWSNLTHC
ncbi:hypothetical protein F4604DRAFT_1934564 [Suillus subluteus]|nr:hypothetical protein F4604DRAFT_1934564 [Suillus subluteus]